MFKEDGIDTVKELRKNIKDCEDLCNGKEESELNKQIVKTLAAISRAVEIELMINYRFDEQDI
jgi:hypothetical protein